MTPAELQTIAAEHGGVTAFTKRLGVSRQWFYARTRGKNPVPIKPLDVAAIKAKARRSRAPLRYAPQER